MKQHTCSYYCERPECIRAQRDELRSEADLDVDEENEFMQKVEEWANRKGVYLDMDGGL